MLPFWKNPAGGKLLQDAPERATRPTVSGPLGNFSCSLAELVSVTTIAAGGIPVLRQGHPYKWLTVDPACSPGLFVIFGIGAPLTAQTAKIGTVMAGGSVYVGDGQPVWIGASGFDGAAGLTIQGTAVFWLSSEDSPPAPGLRRQPGELVRGFRGSIASLAAGSDQMICQASDCIQGIGSRLAFAINLAGGAVTSSTADFPMELILRWSDGTTPQYRVWLFPGDAECEIVARLPYQAVQGSLAGATDWALFARNPTGAAAAKDASYSCQVFVDPGVEEQSRYSLSKRVIPASPTPNTIYAAHAYSLMQAFGTNCRAALFNDATGPDLFYRQSQYVPSVFGGPAAFPNGTAFNAAAGARNSAALTNNNVHEFGVVYWTTGTIAGNGRFCVWGHFG